MLLSLCIKKGLTHRQLSYVRHIGIKMFQNKNVECENEADLDLVF